MQVFPKLRTTVVSSALLSAVLSLPVQAAPAGTVPMIRQNNTLYYKLGGGDPSSLPANPNAITFRLGASGNLTLGYSCGKFSIGEAFEAYMTEFSQLGDTLQAAIGSAIAALPMYIFQRAQPGLYEIFQSYWAKAQLAISAALKSCEEMEAQIKQGGNPYEDYLNLAKGERWKVEASLETNLIAAKDKVQKDGGDTGIQVFKDMQRGGLNQPPLRVVRDFTVVGYNLTTRRQPSESPTTVFPRTANRLTSLWDTPEKAAEWAVEVLGDQEVTTCEKPGCENGKAVRSGLGLQPRYEESIREVEPLIVDLVVTGDTTYTKLGEVSAPGIGIGKEVIDSIRRLPAETRGVMTQRLAREVALSRTIERAFAARNLLQTGMSAANYEKPVDDVRKRVEQLNRYIDDLMFEHRVRKDIVSNTAQTLIENDRNTAAAKSMSVPPGRQSSPRELEDGKVSP